MLKNILEYTSIITITIFIINFSYLDSYYETFGISILSYIEYHEILLFTSIWFSKFILIIPIIIFAFLDFKNNSDFPLAIISENVKISQRISNILILFLIVIILIDNLFIKGFYIKNIAIISFITKIIFTFFIVFIYIKNENLIKNKLLTNIILIFFLGLYCLFVRNLGKSNSIEIINNEVKKINYISFIYNDKKIMTSDSIFYIGETKTQLFLYNSKSKFTLIINRDEIKNLILKK